jgi:hypothetical protein
MGKPSDSIVVRNGLDCQTHRRLERLAGARSGEEGGRKSSEPPRAAMAWRMLAPLRALH